MECHLQPIRPPKASALVPWWHTKLIHSGNVFVSRTITQQTIFQSSSFHANYREQGSFRNPKSNKMISQTHSRSKYFLRDSFARLFIEATTSCLNRDNCLENNCATDSKRVFGLEKTPRGVTCHSTSHLPITYSHPTPSTSRQKQQVVPPEGSL